MFPDCHRYHRDPVDTTRTGWNPLTTFPTTCVPSLRCAIPDQVQLIGRWGSDAVKRYVQESALDATHQETTPQDVRQMVADHLLQLQHKYWIVNTATQTVHIPAVPDSCIENTHWFTVCGWRYGLSTFIRTYQLPEHNQCSKCFKYAKNAACEDVDLSD